MIGLSKLISSGLIGLSSSALGIYFIPNYVDSDSESAKLIFSEGEESSRDQKLFNWWNDNQEALSKIEFLLEEFKKSIEKLKQSISKTHGETLQKLQAATLQEQELEKSYSENKSKLQELKNLINSHHLINQRKLDNSAALKQIQFANQSLHSMGSAVIAWGKVIETILCSIHNVDGKQQCTNVENWHKANKYDTSTDLESKIGGGAYKIRKGKLQQTL